MKARGTQLATLRLGGVVVEVKVPIVKRDVVKGKARKPDAKNEVTPKGQAG